MFIMHLFIHLRFARYDKWLAGEDYGRHPEEPNAKPTPAPQPTVEEYLQNEDRYFRKISLQFFVFFADLNNVHPHL